MKAIWIQHKGENHYAEFVKRFTVKSSACTMKISVDTEYAVYVNGKYVAHGQYADFPFYKSFDELDLSAFVKEGENVLAIRAYHVGRSFYVHYHTPPALAFEIYDGETLVAESDESVLGRLSRTYENGPRECISAQLGFNFAYDCTKEDDWINGNGDGFEKIERVETDWKLIPRPIKKCEITAPMQNVAVMQGIVRFNGGNTAGERAQRAYFSPKPVSQSTKKPLTLSTDEAEGVFVIFDLERESAGYFVMDVEVENECDIIVSYGEHLADGRVRANVGSRNFAFPIHLKKGRNSFEHYFRRLGCRYLQLIAKTSLITVYQCTIREWCYPLTRREKTFKDGLVEKLYEVGERTLRTCLHEHYEDCPWREQALYGMDSRNQMLFGYGVFGEYEVPRASMRLLAYSAKDDGLITITAPTNATKRIPSFSLYWILALTENASVDFKEDFVKEMLPYAERFVSIFKDLKTDKGLTSLRGEENWNFYEWVDGLAGNASCKGDDDPKPNDLLLTSLYVVALRKLSDLERKVGNTAKADEYATFADELTTTFECFYDKEKGVYATFLQEGKKWGYHKHTQALVILAGGIEKDRERALGNALMTDELGLIEQTYASMELKYEAIIKATGDIQFVFNDAKKCFGAMLFGGATTFWETERGVADFGGGGSLCHAWSAIPCYLVDKYGWGL